MKFRNLVIAAVLGALCVSAPAFAQKGKMTAKTSHAKKVVKKSTKKTVKHAPMMKKNGKPDMRFKTNKAKIHLKKDGTPDKRFKENKAKKKK